MRNTVPVGKIIISHLVLPPRWSLTWMHGFCHHWEVYKKFSTQTQHIMALLRSNLPAIQVTHLKCTTQRFLSYSQRRATIITINFLFPSPPEETPHLFAITPHSLSSSHPGQTRVYFLSLYVCLLGTLCTRGLIQYVIFCYWLHFTELNVLKVCPSCGNINTPFSQCSMLLHCMDTLRAVYDEDFSCFHFLAITHRAAMNIHVRDLVWTRVFISLGF